MVLTLNLLNTGVLLFHTWNHHLFLLISLDGLFLFDLLLVGVEIIFLAREASGGDHKIS